METYQYSARDPKTGQIINAEVEAQNERAAGKLLIERGLAPIEIKPKSQRRNLLDFRNRITTKQRVIFARQLATLVNAGLPLVQSLQNVQDQTTNKDFKGIIAKIVSDVEAGSTLADALSQYPKLFDSVYVSLVTAGETSGTLDAALERLANKQEKDAEIVGKVRGALVYPFVVLLVLFGVLIFMLVAVLPQVQNIYNELPGASLPFITTWLLAVSHFATKLWWIVVLVIVAVLYFGNRWLKTTEGRDIADRLKMQAWPAGPLFMKLYMARFARTASTLVASGVPLIKMLETTSKAVGNVHVASSINKAIEQVKGGKTLSESLKNDPNFLDLVPGMISIGEQSGQLDSMLAKVADYYEKEVDNQIKSISTIIEPVLMICVGIIALIIVAAVLLPIYSLVGRNINVV